MVHPLSLLGGTLVVIGTSWVGYTVLRLNGRTQVQGTVLAYKEVSDGGLTDSTDTMVVQYTGLNGKTATCSTKPRTSFFWKEIGAQLPVYLAKDGTQPPMIGEFAELWLFPLVLESVGILCLALTLS